MATAYVKNPAISFYSEPDESKIVSEITRNWATEPHYLKDVVEGATLGVLTGKKTGDFVQIIYEFDIRIKQFKTGIKQYVWFLNATDVSTWEHHTETLWVKEADITTESPTEAQKKAAAAKEAARKAQVEKILSGTDPSLTASGGGTTGTTNTTLIVAIGAGLALLAGVLIWAFGGKKAAPQPVTPNIIDLSKKP